MSKQQQHGATPNGNGAQAKAAAGDAVAAAVAAQVVEQIKTCRTTPAWLEGIDDAPPGAGLTACAVCGQWKRELCQYGRPDARDAHDKALAAYARKAIAQFVNFCETYGAAASRLAGAPDSGDLPIARQYAERVLRRLRGLED